MRLAAILCAITLCTAAVSAQHRSVIVPLVGNGAFGRRVITVFDRSGRQIPGPVEIYGFNWKRRLFTFANAEGKVQHVPVKALGRIDFRRLRQNPSGSVSPAPLRVIRRYGFLMPAHDLEIVAGHLTVDVARMNVRPDDPVPEMISIEYDQKDQSFLLTLQEFSL